MGSSRYSAEFKSIVALGQRTANELVQEYAARAGERKMIDK